MPKIKKRGLISKPENDYVIPDFIAGAENSFFKNTPAFQLLYIILVSRVRFESSLEVLSKFDYEGAKKAMSLSDAKIKASITKLEKSGWIKLKGKNFIVGYCDEERGVRKLHPLSDTPKESAITQKRDYDSLKDIIEEYWAFCEGSNVAEKLHGDLVSMLKEISQTHHHTKSGALIGVFCACYEIIHGEEYPMPLPVSEVFIFSNLLKKYKDKVLCYHIIMVFVLHYDKFKKTGSPTPKVLSFLSQDVYNDISGANERRKKSYKNIQSKLRDRKLSSMDKEAKMKF